MGLKGASSTRESDTKLLTLASDDTPAAPEETEQESLADIVIREQQSQTQKHYIHIVGFNGQGVVDGPTEREHRVGFLTFRLARSAFMNTKLN